MKSKEELKKLFENGDKPTQENFWEWQDSYWHKDEKLPTDNSDGYKIKGSVPDKVALDNMTSMAEGDVYNLLDTGDNYVYVLDLNNTGEAGWDKLGGSFIESFIPLAGTEVGKPLTGMIEVDGDYGLIKKGSVNDPNEYSITLNDFSGVKLESPSSNLVVSNDGVSFSTGGTGNSANFGVNSVSGQVLFNVENANYRANHVINNNTEITELIDKVSTEEVQFIKSIEEGLVSDKDFTGVSNPLAFVQKKYVDDNTSLQSVLDNGAVAYEDSVNFGPSYAELDLINKSINFVLHNGSNKFNSLGLSQGFTSIGGISETGSSDIQMNLDDGSIILNTGDGQGNAMQVKLKQDGALAYGADYSSMFTGRSLVDVDWVYNTIYTTLDTHSPNLQKILDTNTTAMNPSTFSSVVFNLNDGVFQLNSNSASDGSAYTSVTIDGAISSIQNSGGQTYLSVDRIRNQSNQYENSVNLQSESYLNGEISRVSLSANNALTYGADYSSKFTNRSLVDKAYVDSKISSPFELSWSPWTNCIVESYQETTFNQLRWRRKGDTIQIDGVAIRQNNNTIGNAFAFMPSQLKPSFDMKFTGWNGRTNSFLMIYFSSDNGGLSINGTASLTDPLFFTIEYTI